MHDDFFKFYDKIPYMIRVLMTSNSHRISSDLRFWRCPMQLALKCPLQGKGAVNLNIVGVSMF